MILRRVVAHFRKQEWTAIALDFLIVVTGVFIGIQVANWNEARGDRAAERAIRDRLETEFHSHVADLQALAERLAIYQEAAKQVTIALKAGAPPDDREQFLEWLSNSTNVGRPPARSATYVQLLSSGDFDLLSNDNLRDLLVRFDQDIERNRIVYDQTIALVVSTDDLFAATNSNFADSKNETGYPVKVIDYDFEELKPSEGKIEWVYYLHTHNLFATRRQLALAREILAQLELE